MDKTLLYNSKYGLIKENIRFLSNKRFIPNEVFCSAMNFSSSSLSFSVGGAGLSKEDSILSTIGEFFERFSASYLPNNSVRSSYKSLKMKGENVVDLSYLNNFYSQTQYDSFKRIRPLHIEDVIEWCPSVDLLNNKQILIPNYCIFLNQNSILSDNFYPIYSIPSTGLSAHSNEKLAVESGFLENVERHSFCDFWYLQNHKRYPVYDSFEILNTFKKNRRIQKLYDNPSVCIFCYDLTSICNIPSFLNIIFFTYKGKFYMTSGASSKFSYEEALIKSALEAYQGIELALWLDKKYLDWKYNDLSNIGFDVTSFHKHFAFYNTHLFLRKEVPVLSRILDNNFVSDSFVMNPNIIDSFDIEKIKNIDNVKNIYYKNVTHEDIKFLGVDVVKVIVDGFHQLTGNHNYPLLGSFDYEIKNLFLKYPHFFP